MANKLSPWSKKYGTLLINAAVGWRGVISAVVTLISVNALNVAEFPKYLCVTLGVLAGAVVLVWLTWISELAHKYAQRDGTAVGGAPDDIHGE